MMILNVFFNFNLVVQLYQLIVQKSILFMSYNFNEYDNLLITINVDFVLKYWSMLT